MRRKYRAPLTNKASATSVEIASMGPDAVGVSSKTAESFYRPHHGIKAIHGAPRLRQQATGISNRRGKEPELREKRHSIAHVMKLHVHG